ncbi:MAG TPA: hypothetical protein VG734_05510 [Lacunisphaera sp.]|nr:hypothetical protein [Lacunisphaera sp.]
MKPFLSGKRTLEAAPLCAPQVHKAAPPRGVVRPAAPEGPSVEVVKQGDKVMRIVVTCSCGEKVEVECLYPAGS